MGTSHYFGYPSVIGIIISVTPLMVYMFSHYKGVFQKSNSNRKNVLLALTYAILLFVVSVLIFLSQDGDHSNSDSDSTILLPIAAMIYLNSGPLYVFFIAKAIINYHGTKKSSNGEEVRRVLRNV